MTRRAPQVRSTRRRRTFAQHLSRSALLAAALAAVSLAVGVLGYHHFARLPWVDALLNASMILSGMGPVDVLPTDAAKIFASCYALYSGLLVLATMGLLVGPFLRRTLEHLEPGSGEPDGPADRSAPRGDLP